MSDTSYVNALIERQAKKIQAQADLIESQAARIEALEAAVQELDDATATGEDGDVSLAVIKLLMLGDRALTEDTP